MDEQTKKIQALTIIAEENYAHARDHEHLRSQITSVLVAASFVVLGLALKEFEGFKLIFSALLVSSLSCLNVYVAFLHTNRFNMHVKVANDALAEICDIRIERAVKKIGRLSATWYFIAAIPGIAGLALLGKVLF